MIRPTGAMLNAGSTSAPQALGTAAAGTSLSYSRADHVHAMPSAVDVGAIPTSQLASLATLDGSGHLGTSQIPAIGGDISLGAGMTTAQVVALQGRTLSAVAPTTGQALQWDGAAWVPGSIPSGGSGGGGVTLFLNYGTAPDDPITGLPGTPYELGRTGNATQTSVTSGTLSNVNFDLVAGFVTDILDPDVTALPAGLFDVNFWASSNSNSANEVQAQVRLYKYDGSTATLIATSDASSIFDSSTVAQYTVSFVVPQTTMALNDRIYMELRAKSTANNKTITLKFGDSTPTHVHTTLPSVGGSGSVFVVNGVFQSPARQIVDADIATNAAVALNKIAGAASTEDVNAVSSAISAITPASLGAMATSERGNYATTQAFAALTPEQIGAMATSERASYISTEQIGSYATTSSVAAITPASIGAFATSQIIAISSGGTGATNAHSALVNLGSPFHVVDLRQFVNQIPLTVSGTYQATWSNSSTTITLTTGDTSLLAPGNTFATTNLISCVITSITNSTQFVVSQNPASTQATPAGITIYATTPTTFTYPVGVQAAVEGVTLSIGSTLCLTSQGNTATNGPWVVTQLGSASASMILTRPSWFSGTSGPLFILAQYGTSSHGIVMAVTSGTSSISAINVGLQSLVCNLVYSRVSNAITSTNTFTGKQIFAANSATVAPAQFNSGASQPLLTTPIAGSIEWDGKLEYLSDACSFTATISGTTLTVTGSVSGIIRVGAWITGTGVTTAQITALGTGVGGTGTYTISVSQTVSTATNMTGALRTINMSAIQPLTTAATHALTTTSLGALGQVAIDSTAIYVCVGPNTWRKAALSTF